jgi:hypothetical protein
MYARPVAKFRHRFFNPSLSSIVTSIIVLGALALTFAPRAGRAAGSAFVRVNQVGYATTETKRAYLMAPVRRLARHSASRTLMGSLSIRLRLEQSSARGVAVTPMSMLWTSGR